MYTSVLKFVFYLMNFRNFNSKFFLVISHIVLVLSGVFHIIEAAARRASPEATSCLAPHLKFSALYSKTMEGFAKSGVT